MIFIKISDNKEEVIFDKYLKLKKIVSCFEKKKKKKVNILKTPNENGIHPIG